MSISHSPASLRPAPPVRLPILDDPSAADVQLVRWPEGASLRLGLAALGRPRVLLIDHGIAPPDPIDQMEDWMRWPADPAELTARARTLAARTRPTEDPPFIDEDGLLRRGDRWVAVTDAQLPVLRLLLEHIERVVTFEAIVAAYESGGGTTQATSVRTAVSRLDARLRELGLELATIRRRGLMLRNVG